MRSLLVGFLLGASMFAGYTYTRADDADRLAECSPAQEEAYEIMRFASYSHTNWLDWFDANDTDVYEGETRAWHQWWADQYDIVLAQMESECIPAGEYPRLDTLPGTWQSYPDRMEDA